MNALAPRTVAALRIAIASRDPARRARLVAMVGEAGHVIALSPDDADAILADGEPTQVQGIPVVMMGGADVDAAGQLPADADSDQIDAALRAVASGLLVRSAATGFSGLAEENLSALLTPREIGVLVAVSEGLGNKTIARRLDISLHTVKFHLESVFRKLGVRTRAEAVARGLNRINL